MQAHSKYNSINNGPGGDPKIECHNVNKSLVTHSETQCLSFWIWASQGLVSSQLQQSSRSSHFFVWLCLQYDGRNEKDLSPFPTLYSFIKVHLSCLPQSDASLRVEFY